MLLDTCSLDIHANVNEDIVVDLHLAGEGEPACSDTMEAMTNTLLTTDINTTNNNYHDSAMAFGSA